MKRHAIVEGSHPDDLQEEDAPNTAGKNSLHDKQLLVVWEFCQLICPGIGGASV